METFSALLRGIHRWPMNYPHRSQWRWALILFICAWINGWVNKREAGDLRRHRPHYDAIAMILQETGPPLVQINGLSPFRCQTAILTKNGLLLIRPLATKWRSFSLGLNVLTCHFSYHQDVLLLNTMSIRLKSTQFDKQIYDKFSAPYKFLLLTSPWLHSVFNNRCNNWHKVSRPRVRPRYGWQSPQFLSLFITCVRCDNEAPIIEKIDCTKLQVGNGVDLMIKHADMVLLS